MESEGKGEIPEDSGIVVSTLDDLINSIYLGFCDIQGKSMEWLYEYAILTPKNDTAAGINRILLESLQRDKIEYKSVDTVLQTGAAVHYPVEFQNTLYPPGFQA